MQNTVIFIKMWFMLTCNDFLFLMNKNISKSSILITSMINIDIYNPQKQIYWPCSNFWECKWLLRPKSLRIPGPSWWFGITGDLDIMVPAWKGLCPGAWQDSVSQCVPTQYILQDQAPLRCPNIRSECMALKLLPEGWIWLKYWM